MLPGVVDIQKLEVRRQRCVIGPANNSAKLQASSLTAGEGYDRINLERNNYGHNTIKKNSGRSRRDSSTSKEGSRSS
jgi:hypothetical protein